MRRKPIIALLILQDTIDVIADAYQTGIVLTVAGDAK